MDGHHLILGELSDVLTGKILPDTHDERYRQKIAKLLLDQKGYLKSDIEARYNLLVQAGDCKGIVPIEFIVRIDGMIAMIVKYGPGSLVTRRRPTLAASRLIAPYQIPIAVITNGEDAEILNGTSGDVLSTGINAIPSKTELVATIAQLSVEPIPKKRAEMESRIVYAYEIDGSCPCDDTICRIQ